MSGNIGANPATNADLFTACQGVVCYLYSGDVLQIIGYGGIGGVLQCLLVITCIVAGLSQRLLAERFVVTTSVSSLLIFVSEEVAVAVETIPEMHNDRVERI